MMNTFLGFAKVRIILISLFSPHVGGGGGGGGGNGTTADRVDNGLYLGVYGGMCLAVVLVEVARDCALFLSAAEASRTIHGSDLAGWEYNSAKMGITSASFQGAPGRRLPLAHVLLRHQPGREGREQVCDSRFNLKRLYKNYLIFLSQVFWRP